MQNKYLLASVLLLIVTSGLLVWNTAPLTHYYEDAVYHIMVAENFAKAGGPVTWQFWGSLPEGRPHTYPPLFHLLLSLAFYTSIDPFLIILATVFSSIILCLTLSWWGVRLLFDERSGFFFLLIATSYTMYLIFLGVIIPASLVLALTPLLLYLILKRRLVGSIALLTILFYLHTIIPWLVVGALVLWSLLKRHHLTFVAITITAAGLLYLPWALHIFDNLNYIKYLSPIYQSLPSVPDLNFNASLIVIFVLAIGSWIIIRRQIDNQKLLFFLTLLVVQLPLLYTSYPSRFFLSGGFMAMAVIIAVVTSELIRANSRLTYFVLIPILGGSVIFWQAAINPSDRQIETKWELSLIPRLIQTEIREMLTDVPPLAPAYTADWLEMAEVIKNNSNPTEPLYSITDYFNTQRFAVADRFVPAQAIGALANRPMVNARRPESYTKELPPLEKQSLVLADYRQTPLFNGQKNSEQQKYSDILAKNFTVIQRVDRLVLLRNKFIEPLEVKKAQPIVSTGLGLGLFFVFSGLVILDYRRARPRAQELVAQDQASLSLSREQLLAHSRSPQARRQVSQTVQVPQKTRVRE
jgi:hypothetical protein